MATSKKAQSVILKKHLEEGIPGDDEIGIIDVETPQQAPEGGVLVELLGLSADPYLRASWKAARGLKPGSVINGYVVGKIIESKNEHYKNGQLFGALLPFTTIQALETPEKYPFFWKLPEGLVNESNVTLGLGIFGMPGATSYGGLEVLSIKKGETIWISAASGAVGSVAAQIAKNVYGCKVIGTAGGPEKCEFAQQKFGYDACVDYQQCKTAEDLENEIRKYAPDGIDCYFENVGGIHFTAAMNLLKPGGRVAVCGTISNYNKQQGPPESFSVNKMIYSQQRIEGFLCVPWLTRQKGNFFTEVPQWYTENKLKAEETVFNGIQQWPAAFKALFVGKNKGKVVVRL